MKRVLTVILAAVLILTGCSKSDRVTNKDVKTVENLSGDFGASGTLTYKDVKAELQIQKSAPQKYIVEFTAPDSLKGMKLTVEEGGVLVEYGVLSYRTDSSSMPSASVLKLINGALSSAVGGGDTVGVTAEGNRLKVAGKTGTGSYVLSLDRDSGNLLEISYPGEQFSIKFENFTFF